MWYVSINRSTPEKKFTFADLIRLQEETLARISPQGESALLFAEVSPTVTLGARQVHDPKQDEYLAALRERLANAGVDLHAGERGGKETWHGPGQWVGFVVTPLEKFTGDSRGVRKAVCKILKQVLEVVHQYQSDAFIDEDDRLGIWNAHGKLVSVGIKIKNGYVTSGFALNCMPHPLSFYGIDPCGLAGALPGFLLEGIAPEMREQEFQSLTSKLVQVFS